MGISTTLEEAADAARVARTGAVRPGARRGGRSPQDIPIGGRQPMAISV